jgi:NAD(P)-dependent dehydrogenase (short-subunit alcohol dehydrogenase family)
MRTAIVTGANRGVGRGVAKQLAVLGYRVILTSRDEAKGKAAVRELADEIGAKASGNLVYHPLDVTDPGSIELFFRFVTGEDEGAEVLVNNAAVLLDPSGRVLQIPAETYRATMETNVYGPLLLCQKFIPPMVKRGYGRVVNVSSEAGQTGNLADDKPAYRLSKLALNGLTMMLADAVRGTNVLVNAVHPGWVRTGMGGPAAPRSIEEAAEGVVRLATLPDGGPSGGLFHDGKRIPW